MNKGTQETNERTPLGREENKENKQQLQKGPRLVHGLSWEFEEGRAYWEQNTHWLLTYLIKVVETQFLRQGEQVALVLKY